METMSAAGVGDECNELKKEAVGPFSKAKMKTACVKGKLADFPALQAIIPNKYDYHVCECTSETNGFRSTLRLPFLTKQECQQWKMELENQTFSTFRVLKTFPKCKHKIVYKIVYRCQHSNVHKRKDSKKGTDCKAMLEFTIKKVYSQSKTKDVHLPSLPCVIKLYWIHNHDFTSTEMLKFRDVADSTREELLTLLRQGHIAPSALKELKTRMKSKLGDDYENAALDRRFVPDIGFVKRLQKEIYGRGYKQCPTDLTSDLQSHVHRHAKKHRSTAAMKKTESGHIILAIATDFMKRVSYYLKESGDVLLVKTTGDKNRYSCRVYLLLTLCCAGGLPIGCLITTSDSTSTIVQGLQLYLSLLNDQAFFGRGYPAVIMAEDSSSESDALRVAFPQSTQLLSTYHILQSAWKWFFGHRKSLIQKKKKPYMFSLLKRMVVSTSPEEIDHFEKIISSEYPSVTTYVAYLYAKKELWGLCFRGNYPLYSNYIYNYVDFEMGALNERILSGINNFNVIELFDLILTKVETYYRGKISGESILQDQTNGVSISIPLSDVNRVEERIFVVKCQFSSLRHFVVNTDLNMCTCFAGFNGGFCEHQASVQKYYNDSFDQIAKFTCLATGKHFQDSWYHFLQLEEVAKSYEVMEAYTAETNDLDEENDDDDDDDDDNDDDQKVDGVLNDDYEDDSDINGLKNDRIKNEEDSNVDVNHSVIVGNDNTKVDDNPSKSNDNYDDDGGGGDNTGIKVKKENNRNHHHHDGSGSVLSSSSSSSSSSLSSVRMRTKNRTKDKIRNNNKKRTNEGNLMAVVANSTKPKTGKAGSRAKRLRDGLKVRLKTTLRNGRGRGVKRKKVKEKEEEEEEISDIEMNERLANGKLTEKDSEYNGLGPDIKMEEEEDNDDRGHEEPECFSGDQTIDRIRKVCQRLEQRVRDKPDIFVTPVNEFLSNLLSPKTDRQLVSTLLSLGGQKPNS